MEKYENPVVQVDSQTHCEANNDLAMFHVQLNKKTWILGNGIVSDLCCVVWRDASTVAYLRRGTTAVPGDGTVCAVMGAWRDVLKFI